MFIFFLAMLIFYFISKKLANRAAKPLEDAIAREKQFITDASHDLKTPLTVILSNADILSRNQACTVSEMSKWIDGTKQAASNMKELIEQMLVLSESETKTEIQKEDVNISDIAEKNALVMESVAYEKNIDYRTEIQPNIIIKGNADYVKRIVTSLIDNAIKYETEGGSICVSLHQSKKTVSFSVQNQSSVISKEDISHVFERFYLSYEKRNSPPAHHRKTAYHIMNCKTGAFGVNISVCEDCGCISIHNNSCRSRCCPMCQEFPKEKWIDAQKENVLDAPYYHVVFTVPEELNSIIYSNQKLLYDALYHAASATLNELSKDAKYLGADIGYICILHTWGSAMNYHPHIHTIVLGGGLDDENKWKETGGNFFLPYGVISKVFRGKYLDELKSLWNDSKLKFHGTAEKYQNSYRFKELLDKCYEKNWVTYCKETFNGAQSVINYLGKYTHRIAISNHRIKSMTDTTVTYAVKDYKNEGHWKEKTISGEEFIRRFMMHVPPKRFVRIRHYGLLSCRNKRKKITHCRNLLGCKKYISTLKNLNAVEMIKVLYHIDVCKCSSCGGNMVSPRKDKYSSSFHAHVRC